MHSTLLVAHDATPRAVFTLLKARLETKGARCRLVTGTDDTGNIPESVKDSSVVLCGMSTPAENATIEADAARLAAIAKKPFGFFSDNFGAFKRDYFIAQRAETSLVLVSSESEKKSAKKLFPTADIVVSGNPLWHEYFVPKDRLAARRLVGASDDEILVLVPFTKTAALNFSKMLSVIRAVSICGRKSRIVIGIHPGDKTTPEAYERLVTVSNRMKVVVVISREKEGDLLPGADFVIGPTGAAMIHAMARKIPLIDVVDPFIRAWLEEDRGARRTYAAEHGAAIEVSNHRSLAQFLSSPERFARVRARQAELVPQVDKERSLDIMAEATLKAAAQS